MKVKQISFVIFLLISSHIFSQNPCSSPESHQFDFWIGKWNLEWTGADGKTYHAINEIKKILGGCVIAENFDASKANGFQGKSFSVYNSSKSKWEQTWVDNSGGYMIFEGGMEGDKMILSLNKVDKQGKPVILRMVFSNITHDSLDWHWQRSSDNGKYWQTLWHLKYRRMK